MSRHRFVVVANVVDFMLDEHDSDSKPPPNAIHDWESSDLLDALELGILDDVEIETYEGQVH